MIIIDSHSHVVLPLEDHIALMDEAGVKKTVLFATSVHPEKASDMNAFEEEMNILHEIIAGKRNAGEARVRALDELYAVIKNYPSRFVGFANVSPGMSTEDTCAWIEEHAQDKKIVGLGEFTLASGQIVSLEPVFCTSNEIGKLPLWIHAFFPLTISDIREIVELARKFPTVPVIIGHLGGVHWLDTIHLAKEVPNIYLDLSAFYAVIALKMAIQALPERTLFSADLPYGDLVISRQAVERVCAVKHVREQVLGGTICKLLQL